MIHQSDAVTIQLHAEEQVASTLRHPLEELEQLSFVKRLYRLNTVHWVLFEQVAPLPHSGEIPVGVAFVLNRLLVCLVQKRAIRHCTLESILQVIVHRVFHNRVALSVCSVAAGYQLFQLRNSVFGKGVLVAELGQYVAEFFHCLLFAI